MGKVSKFLFILFWITLKTIMIGIIGMGLYSTIPTINFNLVGHNYSLFAACALSGLLWMLIPDFWSKTK